MLAMLLRTSCLRQQYLFGIHIFSKICHSQGCCLSVSNSVLSTVPSSSIVLDQLQDRLRNVSLLRQNVSARKMNIDLTNICSRFERLQLLEKQKNELFNQKKENAQAMKILMKDKGENYENKKQKLIEKGKDLRFRSRQFLGSSEYQTLCVQVMRDLLLFPNDINASTPMQDVIIEEILLQNAVKSVCVPTHIELGLKYKCIYTRPDVGVGAVYLANELATAEQQLIQQVSRYLRKADIEQIACSDLVKSHITDKCSVNVNQGFTIEGEVESTADSSSDDDGNSRHSLELTGVSTASFSAFFSSMVVKHSSLPCQLFSIGRSYTSSEANEQTGLFGVHQATTVNVFGAGKNDSEVEHLYNKYLQLIRQLYSNLNLPAKVVQVSASNLKSMESQRVDFYVWSAALKQFFKCGELSQYNDYIGQRLAMKSASNVAADPSTASNLHTVHGVVIKVPTVLAALVETHQTVNNLLNYAYIDSH